MKTLKAIIGLLALLTIMSQMFRHLYVRFVEPRESVLQQFDQTKQDIAAAKSLEELLALYRPALDKVREENAKEKSDADMSEYYRRMTEEPYKSEDQLRAAILEWEDHHQKLVELHFFWWAGLVALGLGLLAHWKSKPQLGLSFFVLGYLEMIWATSPSFQTFGYPLEFERLLTLKVVYSCISTILLLVTWKYFESNPGDAANSPRA